MITALLGFTYAAILMQGDVFREHIQQEPIILYAGQSASLDAESWIAANRASRFVVGFIEWTNGDQYKNDI